MYVTKKPINMFTLAKKDTDQPGSDFTTNDWNVILRPPDNQTTRKIHACHFLPLV